MSMTLLYFGVGLLNFSNAEDLRTKSAEFAKNMVDQWQVQNGLENPEHVATFSSYDKERQRISDLNSHVSMRLSSASTDALSADEARFYEFYSPLSAAERKKAISYILNELIKEFENPDAHRQLKAVSVIAFLGKFSEWNDIELYLESWTFLDHVLDKSSYANVRLMAAMVDQLNIPPGSFHFMIYEDRARRLARIYHREKDALVHVLLGSLVRGHYTHIDDAHTAYDRSIMNDVYNGDIPIGTEVALPTYTKAPIIRINDTMEEGRAQLDLDHPKDQCRRFLGQ